MCVPDAAELSPVNPRVPSTYPQVTLLSTAELVFVTTPKKLTSANILPRRRKHQLWLLQSDLLRP
jgi:hypothetical protein